MAWCLGYFFFPLHELCWRFLVFHTCDVNGTINIVLCDLCCSSAALSTWITSCSLQSRLLFYFTNKYLISAVYLNLFHYFIQSKTSLDTSWNISFLLRLTFNNFSLLNPNFTSLYTYGSYHHCIKYGFCLFLYLPF
jgi:hypothetical protein